MLRPAALGLVAAALAFALGCQQANPPVVQQRTLSAPAGSTRRVAVMPFSPRLGAAQQAPEVTGLPERPGETVTGTEIATPAVPDTRARDDEPELTPTELGDLVATFMAEALVRGGTPAVMPSDMALVFTNEARAVPRRDPREAVRAASQYGASSVVVGEVLRWRERVGSSYGSGRPASVAFAMRLHEVPSGRKLWDSRFDHTQRTLTADPLTARKYPGGGTRFLTATELARWGVEAAAASLLSGQWRASN